MKYTKILIPLILLLLFIITIMVGCECGTPVSPAYRDMKVVINDDAGYTTSEKVTLTLSCISDNDENIEEFIVGNTSDFSDRNRRLTGDSDWEKFPKPGTSVIHKKEWTIKPDYAGNAVVYAQFRGRHNTLPISDVVSDSIAYYDTTNARCPTIVGFEPQIVKPKPGTSWAIYDTFSIKVYVIASDTIEDMSFLINFDNTILQLTEAKIVTRPTTSDALFPANSITKKEIDNVSNANSSGKCKVEISRYSNSSKERKGSVVLLKFILIKPITKTTKITLSSLIVREGIMSSLFSINSVSAVGKVCP